MGELINELKKKYPSLQVIKKYRNSGQKNVYLVSLDTYGVVILKIIKKMDERIRREIDIVNNNDIPGVPKIKEISSFWYNGEEQYYLIEEYIDGESLSDEIKRGPLQLSRALKLFESLLIVVAKLESIGIVHRDISPKNILIKKYDDTIVVKLSDFGLVKIPDSKLTTVNTEFKGYFNDPALVVEGFDTYDMVHEIYALTRVIYFVMTGKTNTDKIANQQLRNFVEVGLNPDKTKRFQNVKDMISAFKTI